MSNEPDLSQISEDSHEPSLTESQRRGAAGSPSSDNDASDGVEGYYEHITFTKSGSREPDSEPVEQGVLVQQTLTTDKDTPPLTISSAHAIDISNVDESRRRQAKRRKSANFPALAPRSPRQGSLQAATITSATDKPADSRVSGLFDIQSFSEGVVLNTGPSMSVSRPLPKLHQVTVDRTISARYSLPSNRKASIASKASPPLESRLNDTLDVLGRDVISGSYVAGSRRMDSPSTLRECHQYEDSSVHQKKHLDSSMVGRPHDARDAHDAHDVGCTTGVATAGPQSALEEQDERATVRPAVLSSARTARAVKAINHDNLRLDKTSQVMKPVTTGLVHLPVSQNNGPRRSTTPESEPPVAQNSLTPHDLHVMASSPGNVRTPAFRQSGSADMQASLDVNVSHITRTSRPRRRQVIDDSLSPPTSDFDHVAVQSDFGSNASVEPRSPLPTSANNAAASSVNFTIAGNRESRRARSQVSYQEPSLVK